MTCGRLVLACGGSGADWVASGPVAQWSAPCQATKVSCPHCSRCCLEVAPQSPHGACFMEFASLLAGERWSDHPACTHPLLAAVARHVNDYTTDAGRPQLATLIPSVIGLTGDDLHIDARIALGSATMALPVVAAERQRVMAVSVLTCERLLGRTGWATGGKPSRSRAPRPWRTCPTPHGGPPNSPAASGRPRNTFAVRAAPAIVHQAAQGIAQACVPDPDKNAPRRPRPSRG